MVYAFELSIFILQIVKNTVPKRPDDEIADPFSSEEMDGGSSYSDDYSQEDEEDEADASEGEDQDDASKDEESIDEESKRESK